MSAPDLNDRNPSAAAARAELGRCVAEARAADAAGAGSAEEFARAAEAVLDAFPEESFAPGGTLPGASRALPPAAQSVASESGTKVVQFPGAARRWPLRALALAAGVVLAGGLLLRSLLTPPASTDQLRDGPLRVAADGRINSAQVPPDLLAIIQEAIQTRSVAGLLGEAGLLRGGTEPSVSLRGGLLPPEPKPLTPTPGSTIEDDRPEFRWQAVPGVRGYVVVVAVPAQNEYIESPELPPTQTTWRVTPALERGAIHRWKVSALFPDGQSIESSPVVLKVLSHAEIEMLQTIRRQHAGSRLILAAAYARAGLEEQARKEIAELAREQPGSKLAQDFAASMK